MRTLLSTFVCSSILVLPIALQEPAPPDAKYDGLVREIASCAAIHDTAKRLEAYDALAKELGVGPKPLEGQGKWSVKASVSPIDDSRSVLLSLEADKESTIRLKGGQQPQLVVRCKAGTLDLYVIAGAKAEKEGEDPQATVTLRFDKRKAIDVKMDQSTDGEAFFWPDPAAHVERMLGAEKLIFVFTPEGAAPALVQFDLRGLAAVHPQLAEACPKAK